MASAIAKPTAKAPRTAINWLAASVSDASFTNVSLPTNSAIAASMAMMPRRFSADEAKGRLLPHAPAKWNRFAWQGHA